MRVLEESVAAKSGDPETCEDGIVTGPRFAAVIDGATDKSGRRFDGMSGGRLVMTVLAGAIPELPPEVDGPRAVELLTEAVSDRLPRGLPTTDRPSAALTIYSVARHEIWQIGDVDYWYPGKPDEPASRRKDVDRITAEMRAAILRAELLRGTAPEELAAEDPGRAAIMPLLTRQVFFANEPAAGDLAYGALDGRPVPPELITIRPLPSDVTEIVLGSDGYPRLHRTLSESERHLKLLLAEDPLCMGELAGTKAVAPGQDSFDDRAYLRLEL